MKPRDILEQAQASHRGGDLAKAERLYQSVLNQTPTDVVALHGLGLLHARRGRFDDARQYVDRALGLDPMRPELHFHRAEILGALGLAEQALDSYRRALALRPDYFDALVNMGDALLRQGQAAQALDQLDRAVRIRPDDIAALNNRGNALQALKRPGEALQCFDKVLAKLPEHPDVLNNRASALLAQGRFAEAEAACRTALARQPSHAQALLNLGRSQGAQGRLADALRDFDAALALEPTQHDAWCERAAILRELQRYDEARQSLEKALDLEPDAAGAWNDLGATLLFLNRYPAALEACDRALARQPDQAGTWANKGLALRFLNRYEDAIPAYDRALRIDAQIPYAPGLLTWLRMSIGDWRSDPGAVSRSVAAVREGKRACEPLEFLFLSGQADDQLACARIYAEDRFPERGAAVWRGERYRHERIRVAYVSADFREHPASYLLARLFESHDRSRFEVFGVSIGPKDNGPTATRVAAAFEHFARLTELTDREIAAWLCRHEIDIAIDLMGYTTFCRTGVYALRPCPVQVNYLGFPATMGADFIDYLIADAVLVPAGQEGCYAEKVVRLPDTFQANESLDTAAQGTRVRSVLGLPEHGMVYCSFNKCAKVTPEMFSVWMDVLREVDRGVLWLWADSAALEDNLRREAVARGIAPARLVFAKGMPYPDHLARLRLADLCLDTLPFNGGATTSDALRAGVPVLACAGDALAARMSASLLHAIGMPELIVSSLEDYKALAIRLGNDSQLLVQTKEKLARNRATRPLFDTDRFRRHIEAAYEIMWQRAQRGEPPASFSVPAIADAHAA